MFLKRIAAILTILLAFFIQSAFCNALHKVKDIIIDSSDKIVLIQGEGNFKSENQMLYAPIPTVNQNSINLITGISTSTLLNPARYIIDIPNSTLTGASRIYKLQNSSHLQNIQVSQISTNPNVVKIIFTLNTPQDLINFKTYTNGKDIIVKYNNKIIDNTIQYKFYTPSGDMDKNVKIQNTSSILTYNNSVDNINIIPKLQTKYYLSQINQNTDGLILKGLGSISFQKIIYSKEDTQAVFILDNTSMSSKLENKTYNIPSSNKNINATITINKINEKKIKLTLLGNNLKDYRFVVSPDGQSIFVSHRSYILKTPLSNNLAKIKAYKFSKDSNGYNIFDITFDKSITYDVFELNNNFYIDIDNMNDFSENLFKQALTQSKLNIKASKISSDKTRYIIPMENLNFAYANIESNLKSIKLFFKEKPTTITQTTKPTAQTNTNQVKVSDNNISGKSTSGNINVVYIPKSEDIKNDKEKIEKQKKKREGMVISSSKKVVLDPGHGGNDSGAISGGIYEKIINLEIAKLVEQKLLKKNVYVYMTRSKDMTLTLEDRVNYSNEINPDIYVSIHTNSTVKEDSYGLETHYYKDDSYELAKTIHSNFANWKNLTNWQTKDRGVIKSRFYVINHTEAPSVLIEIGFLSNNEERAKLLKKERQEEIASAIVKGILEYLKVK